MKGIYEGKKIELNIPLKGDIKKYKVFVDTLSGIKKVEFDGIPTRNFKIDVSKNDTSDN